MAKDTQGARKPHSLEHRLSLPEYINNNDASSVHFLRFMLHGSRVVQSTSWSCDSAFDDVPFTFLYKTDSGRSAYVESSDHAAYITLEHGTVNVRVAAETEEDAAGAIDTIKVWLPPDARTISNQIPIWLWTMTPQGPHSIRRKIDVPFWNDIYWNYAEETRAEVARLMDRTTGEHGIILWNGTPGTGKTYALRALGAQWQSWCDIHYIVDPEVMFGSEASYLLSVVLGDDDGKLDSGTNTERWRLLVLEDTGEMLTVDAKQNVGQALSRLLNITDGLLGQGMRIMVMVTTNEELGILNRAVLRPGRCMARTSFDPLGPEQATAWLARHGAAIGADTEGMTLADLYASLIGEQKVKRRRVGLVG